MFVCSRPSLSILFFLYSPRYWQGVFVWLSEAYWICDHFHFSHDLYIWLKGDMSVGCISHVSTTISFLNHKWPKLQLNKVTLCTKPLRPRVGGKSLILVFPSLGGHPVKWLQSIFFLNCLLCFLRAFSLLAGYVIKVMTALRPFFSELEGKLNSWRISSGWNPRTTFLSIQSRAF